MGAHQDDDNGTDSGSAYVFHRDHGGPDSWGQVTKIIPDDGAEDDRFGGSVAVSGDMALIGASGSYGATTPGWTYIFQRSHVLPNAWGQVAKITPADGYAGIEFGSSVAVSINTCIVGAPRSPSVGYDSGSAYLFTISDAFFADGFETGDTSGWSATGP